MKLADAIIAGVVLAVVMLIIVPLSTAVLDILLIINIAASIFVLLTALYIKEPLEISILPTILLILTLFRLALNVSSTKLILGNGGYAGDVIATFGSFVIGKNLVVGLIVFVIIVAIQFIVITKGSERVAEVAARFTLDAMPGKQMAIDADLNTGAIDEATAKKRRTDIQREADFYGAMDGASKFIKGDAIIGIIITLVNVIGGLIIGVAMGEMELSDAVQVYTLATVGDGLVSQIPALLTSTSTGIVVTRSNSDQSFGANVAMQLFGKPYVMIMAGAILVVMSLIPVSRRRPCFFLPSCFLCSAILPSASRRKRKPKKSWIRHRRLQRKSGSRKILRASCRSNRSNWNSGTASFPW
jgi:flagellar biosynthesis protein FlhA